MLVSRNASAVAAVCWVLFVSGAVSAQPVNDTAAGAHQLWLNLSVEATTVGATDDYRAAADCPRTTGSLAAAPDTAGPDLVYVFVAPSAGDYTVNVRFHLNNVGLVLYAAPTPPPGAPAIVPCRLLANRNTNSTSEELTLTLAAGESISLFVDSAAPGSVFRIGVTQEAAPGGGDTIGTAVPFTCGVRQQIGSAGDVDFYALGRYPVGFRVFAIVDAAAGSQEPDGGLTDLTLRVTSATDTLEFDDDDNSNGFGEKSANVGGTPLTGGPAYLRVAHASPTGVAFPYHLYAVVQPPRSSATAELEPNGTLAQAVPTGAMYFSGALTAGDTDIYRVSANAGDLLSVGLDADPTRDGSVLQGVIQLVDAQDVAYSTQAPAGSWGVANSTPSPGTLVGATPVSPGLALFYRVPASGEFFVKVRGLTTTATGDYLLSVGRNCATGATPSFRGRPTATQTFRREHTPPVAISAGAPNTVTSSITVSGAGSYLTDINATTFLTHTYSADLRLSLTSPAGTVVQLASAVGSGNDDVFNGTVWDDQADPGDRSGTTTLTLQAPSVDGITAVRYDWRSAPVAAGLVTEADIRDLTMTLLAGATVVYEERIVAKGIVLPIGANARTHYWRFANGTLVEAANVTNPGATLPASTGIRYDVSDDGSFDTDFRLFVQRWSNGVAVPDAASTLVSNVSTTGAVPSRLARDHAYADAVVASPLVPAQTLGRFVGENPNGTWTLTVEDSANQDGGALSAWSLDVTSLPSAPLEATENFTGGAAGVIPDLGAVSSSLTVPPASRELLEATVSTQLRHPRASDLRISLTAPGTSSRPGGIVGLTRGLGALDSFNGTLWTHVAGVPAVADYNFAAGPAPALLPLEGFAALAGFDVTGLWTLTVADEASGPVATPTTPTHALSGWSLNLTTLVPCQTSVAAVPGSSAVGGTQVFQVTVNDPTCAWTATSRVPWFTITGGAGRGSGTFQGTFSVNATAQARFEAVRVSTRGFPAAGQPGADGAEVAAVADVMQQGTIYTLAEGATGQFFDYDLLLANPTASPAPYTISFLRGDGVTVSSTGTLPSQSRATIRVDDIPGLEATAVSAVVTSTNGLPLVVERTMSWDTGYYGGHTGRALDVPSRTWYFAEGSQGFFDTYVLLANPTSQPVNATVTFLLEDGAPVTESAVLQPTSRTNVFAGLVPGLAGKGFSITVTADAAIFAERAMYFGGQRFGEGGHESPGVPAPATSWLLAEGATGPYFDTFVLVANPNPDPTTIEVNYLLASGIRLTRSYSVAGNRRFTIWLDQEDPLMADTAVSTTVTATRPVVVERAMYWPGQSTQWVEAHNALGVTAPALRWGLAEGRSGGPREYDTFILLANPSTTQAAQVQVTFLREGGLPPVLKTFTVPPTSRTNIWVKSDAPELALPGESRFGALIDVTNGVPIAVERAMYWTAGGIGFGGGTTENGTRVP